MQQWEYMNFETIFDRVSAVNGEEIPGTLKSSPTISEALEDAGAAGWELVQVLQVSVQGKPRYYFKRPKE